MHPASEDFISLASIWAYWRKTLHELSKISVEHVLHAARIQFPNSFLMAMHLVQQAQLWPLVFQ